MSSGQQQGGVGGDTSQELKGIGKTGEFFEGEKVQVQGQVIKILPNGTAVLELDRGQWIVAPVESCARIQ